MLVQYKQFFMTGGLDDARRVERHPASSNWQDPVSNQKTGIDGASCTWASSRCCEHIVLAQLAVFQLRTSRCCEHTCLVRLAKGLGCNAKLFGVQRQDTLLGVFCSALQGEELHVASLLLESHATNSIRQSPGRCRGEKTRGDSRTAIGAFFSSGSGFLYMLSSRRPCAKRMLCSLSEDALLQAFDYDLSANWIQSTDHLNNHQIQLMVINARCVRLVGQFTRSSDARLRMSFHFRTSRCDFVRCSN